MLESCQTTLLAKNQDRRQTTNKSYLPNIKYLELLTNIFQNLPQLREMPKLYAFFKLLVQNLQLRAKLLFFYSKRRCAEKPNFVENAI